MAEPFVTRARVLSIYAIVFAVGAVLMGFEMLGSRYLNPWFGGGIDTWASLISLVLLALTVGYFAGGALVDRYPTPAIAGIPVLLAGAYFAGVPATADSVMRGILENVGDGPDAILLAASSLILVPLSLLGMLSPVVIRLLIRSTAESGMVAGLVYGVSTLGNVVGTLATTFVLIPSYGSRAITYIFAGVLAASGIALTALGRAR